ncbi:MAG: ABC transporter substrate-binding protein [Anaerolineales bacterium]|nr:ABC transporter substrate-binding protein [Anaerolineales bacterium]
MPATSRLWRIVSALTVFALAAAACAPAATPVVQTQVVKETEIVKETQIVQQEVVVTATPEPFKPVGTLRIALTTDIAAIEFPQAPERQAANASWTLYDSLIAPLPDGTFEPALAESWEVSPDGKAYTFHLRQGVTFHNGEPFNADAVVYSWQVYSQPDVRYATYFTIAQSVEKVDDHTVTITTEQPNALLLPYIANGWAIIPPKYHAEVGLQKFAEAPVGTGPFMFKEWIKGDHLTVVANPNYWRKGYPKVAEVVFKFLTDSATRVAAVQAGDVDISPRLTTEDAQSLLGEPGVQIIRYPTSRIYYLAFNNVSTGQGTPLEDVKVRQALAYAIDMDGIIQAVFSGYATRAVGYVAPGELGFDNADPVPYDPDKAKQLLAEAGYPDGFEMGYACPESGYPKINDVCLAIEQQLNAVGIRTKLDLQEANAYWDREAKKELPPLFVDSWSATLPEAYARLQGALAKDETYANWYDAKLDKMISDLQITVDTNARAALYGEIQKYMRENPPFVYLYIPEAFEAVSTRVQNYRPRSAENYYLWDVSVSDGQ